MTNTLLISFFALLIFAACTKSNSNDQQPRITRSIFGSLADGQLADLYILRNAQGMEAKITNYGGIIVSLTAPDKAGQFDDVTLGFDSLNTYATKNPYFGALIGRYSNRIAKGIFTLDGKIYRLPLNDGPNSLHGGTKGFDKVLWAATPLERNEPALKLTYLAKDKEEGYPGTLAVEVTYTLQNNNALRIDYQANTDKPTVVNLTNHTYFDLSVGKASDILSHELSLKANWFLPVDQSLIPTGERKAVTGTLFDFTESTVIGSRIGDTFDTQLRYGKGYDHCWVFTDSSRSLKSVATVYEPTTGRVMSVSTTEPAVQFYTGNFLDGKLTGKARRVYKQRTGFCLETQHYPDAPNQPNFPTTVLRPGQTYKTTTIYQFSVKK